MDIRTDVPLARWCTLGVGGSARWFVEAHSEDDALAALAWAAERNLPVQVLGGGSNVVIADTGVDGLLLQIAISGVRVGGDDTVATYQVGSGEPWDPFVAQTVDAGCAGLECLSGIPGLLGGTPVQNVGAYGQDVSGTITSVRVIDRAARAARTMAAEECGFGYRTSRFKHADADRFIVTGVEFALARSGPPTLTYADVVKHFASTANASPTLAEVRDAILSIRRKKGMVIEAGNPANNSVGSFWVNPVIAAEHVETLAGAPHYPAGPSRAKVPAAWLIEHAGFPRGHVQGSVGISPFQSQAIINRGGARAADVLALALAVKRAVWNRFRIALVPEPVFVGFGDNQELYWLRDPSPSTTSP